MLLLGGEGSGKTSTMTKFTRKAIEKLKWRTIEGVRHERRAEKWLIFYHFAGATPGSSDLMSMLHRLLLMLEVVPESGLPKSVEACAQLCCMALSNPATPNIVIIVDAVDQVSVESMPWHQRT